MSPDLETYLKRLRWGLSGLPEEDRNEIVLETRSHFLDRLEGPNAASFAAVAQELGPPEEYARRFRENYEISAALGSGSAFHMLHAVARLLGRSLQAFVGFFFFLFLYLSSLAFLLVAVLKPIFPENTGLWTSSREPLLLLGFIEDPARPGLHEHLGWWIIPFGLLGALLLYWGSTALLRVFLRSLRRSRESAPSPSSF